MDVVINAFVNVLAKNPALVEGLIEALLKRVAAELAKPPA